jgi:hypothetical protein
MIIHDQAFTKAEITEMYCKVKSLDDLSRRRLDLRLFEKRWDLECKPIDSIRSDKRVASNLCQVIQTT